MRAEPLAPGQPCQFLLHMRTKRRGMSACALHNMRTALADTSWFLNTRLHVQQGSGRVAQVHAAQHVVAITIVVDFLCPVQHSPFAHACAADIGRHLVLQLVPLILVLLPGRKQLNCRIAWGVDGTCAQLRVRTRGCGLKLSFL